MSNSREIFKKIINEVISGNVESASLFYSHLGKHSEDILLLDQKLNEIEAKQKSEKSDSIHETVFLGMAALYKKDYIIAKKYLELGARQNHPVACNDLGYLYQYGYGVDQDYAKAVEYYKLAASYDFTTAFSNLGWMYLNGLGVQTDIDQAINYYQKAADLGNASSQNRLGVMFSNQGTISSYKKALHYFHLAAEQNDACAYYNIGNAYFKGMGVDVNFSKAEEYYQLAISLGYGSLSFIHLGLIYLDKKTDSDYKKAILYFEMAAEQKDADVFLNLGELYYHGTYIERNYSKAFSYFSQGSALNNAQCYNWIGRMYEDGLGVKANLDSAIDYYQLAASFKNPFSLNRLGVYYFSQCTTSGYERAFNYFTLAANQQYEWGYHNLGNAYLHGRGVDMNLGEAEKYYQLAKDLGNVPSMNQLGLIYLTQKTDYKKAIEYFEMAAKRKDGDAFLHLGTMYERGKGFDRDNCKAAEYYRIAAEKGVASAQEKLQNLDDYKVAVTYHKAIVLKTEKLVSCFNIVATSFEEEFDNLAYQDSWETIKPLLNETAQVQVGERQIKNLSEGYRTLKEFLLPDLINIIYMYSYYGNDMHFIKIMQEHINFEEKSEAFKQYYEVPKTYRNTDMDILTNMADISLNSISKFVIGSPCRMTHYHVSLLPSRNSGVTFYHRSHDDYLTFRSKSIKKRRVPDITPQNKIVSCDNGEKESKSSPIFAKYIKEPLLKHIFFARLEDRHTSREAQEEYDKKFGMVLHLSSFKK